MILPQDVGADSTIQNKEGMTAVDVAPIAVLHVFKKDVAKVPPLEEQQQEQQQPQQSVAEEPPHATKQIKLKLREEHSDYIGGKAKKASGADGGVTSATQNSNGTASDEEISFCAIKRALSPPRKPSPRREAAEDKGSEPEGPKQIPESMDIDPAAPSVISEEKANKSFSGKVPEKPAPIQEKPGASLPPPKQRPVSTPSNSSSGGAFSRAAAILEMSKASKGSKAQSPAVVAAAVQATVSADSAEQSARNGYQISPIRLSIRAVSGLVAMG